MKRILACLAALLPALYAAESSKYLFRGPTLNKSHIVFSFAGDLWRVDRAGGEAQRFTTGPGLEMGPKFSPDGAWVAFTGQYDGNTDVFVVPASGGVPKRITSHPGVDVATGWSPDSKRILFYSSRHSYNYPGRLFTVSRDGGFPEEIPLPIAAQGSFSADGKQIAYLPLDRADQAWKNYRGGRATPIWIAQLSDSSVTKLPRVDSNDYNPMWIDDAVYFLSDREGPVTLFKYDIKPKKVTRAIDNAALDLKSADAGPGAIVYEQFGAINTYDLKSGKTQKIEITLNGDLPEVRPRMEKVFEQIRGAGISPTGARAIFEARGDIYSVPAQKGNARNLTATEGAAERSPAWSPDGKSIAYFSDVSGEYELHIRPQSGDGEVKKISLGKPSTFYYNPLWSPDSKKIAYFDKTGTLYYLELEKGTPVRIDKGAFDNSRYMLDPAWSPDSKWIAYAKQAKTHMCSIYAYSLESGKSDAITDGMSHALSPRFDKSGKYLYFMASTDIGPGVWRFDMSATFRPETSTVYVTVLSKDTDSPLKPESDEEKVGDDKKAADEKKEPEKKDGDADKKPEAEKKPDPKAVTVKIDFDGISQRILPLPMPARNYRGIETGKANILFVAEAVPNVQPGATVHRFDLEKRKAEKFSDDVRSFEVSANGEKALVRVGPNWLIAPSTAPLKPGEGKLNMEELEVRVDPKAEWAQMYREAFRIQRDFFYDPGFHGMDIHAARERYETYLANLSSRADLNYLFQEMWGNLSVGHWYVNGGDSPRPKQVKGGLLGADYKIENGRYRFARVYNGENWNPETKAPLTQPGVNVKAGDYILAVDGRDVRGDDEIYSFFEATAGKAVRLKVGPDPTGTGSREVTVVPLESESLLRTLAWIEDNRRKVDQATNGQIAYLHLPDTANGGYTYFNRFYFPQTDRKGVIVDERFNRGGVAADYIIDHLNKKPLSYWATRDGAPYTTPGTAIFGPKAMIINEYAGSGGDLMPWFFRRNKIGPLIGKRTWGGLVGIGGYPTLIDGGAVTAPHFAFWSPEGKWDVENHGVTPDIEVELDPKAWREGRDPQLEKAIEYVMAELKKNPPVEPKQPPYPNYYKTKPAAPASGGNGGQR